MRFCGLTLADPVPDANTLWDFREALIAAGALDALFALARADGVPVLVYKAPHRPGMHPFFHRRADYDAYHEQLAARCAPEGATYVDLQELVPAELWGRTNNNAPDVFHFREEGHRRLGRAVDGALAGMGF